MADKFGFAEQKVKLPDICTIQYGFAFDSKNFTENVDNIPLVRIRDVKRGYSETYYSGDYDEEYIVREGDLLIGMDGEFNIARWRSRDSLLNQRVCRIQAQKGTDEEYLRYVLVKKLKQIEERTAFVTVKHLSAKELNAMALEIPAYEAQKTLSSQLSKIEGLIELRQKQLEQLDTLIKARFVEMFGDPFTNPMGWSVKPLSEVIVNANNGMARRGNDEEGSIVLRLVELQDGYINYDCPNRILLNDKEKQRYLLKDKDFLFARVNGNPLNVGRCAVFRDIGEDVYHNDHIIRVHFDEEQLNGCYASSIFNSDYGKSQMANQIKTSAGQYTISQDGIGAIESMLPPMELQNRFASFVTQVDKLKVVVQESLNEAQTLFDSLMQEYFV